MYIPGIHVRWLSDMISSGIFDFLVRFIVAFPCFHSLSGFTGFPGVVRLPIASVDASNISNVLNFAFRGPVPEMSFFFFSQPVAGLTNWVPVQDSWARAPLYLMALYN